MKPFAAAALLVSTTALAACATTPMAAPVAAAPAADPAAERAALHDLFERSDTANLARNPVSAFVRGDYSQADRLGDFSPAYYQRERAAAEANLAELRAIDRSVLSEIDQLAYDTFEYAQERVLAMTAPDVLPTVLALPVDHFQGFHVFYPRLSAPGALLPFDTARDYANNVARHRNAAQIVAQSIARMRQGVRDDITLPRLSVEIMIDQLDTILNAPDEANPYYAPLAAIPPEFSEAEARQAREQLTDSVANTLMPALRRFRGFLADEYLPAARPSIAATATPQGERYYQYRIKEMTTLDLTADEIHRTGLAEVARINAGLAEARAEAEARGLTAETYETKAELQEAWYETGRMVDPLMDRLFLRQPRTPLHIEPYEPYREAYSLAASYFPGQIDGSRPGTFYFSGYNVAERELGTSVSLYMHEGNPGHHFQIMFAYENEDLPNFMRYDGYTAFSEGWGLYAEHLGTEIGLYDDPIERAKYLGGGELLRAVRLVVDTGMHSKGWTRERAIEYMVENGQPRDFAETETARYIVMPGQALAYKVGELKIKELRAEAEAALGDAFDVRRFHDQVLSSGNIPLPVLEEKIDAWVAAGGR
ncbi:DUF885 domain-containing protein [Sphingomicrobium sp. XHP0239]|uniref:DUF885 domain-containing protein n=1 Tax=Sphingomicrobium maritimum TaxID=3133972 RepID=UPI0031CC9C70